MLLKGTLAGLLTGAALVLAACGGGDDDTSTTNTNAPASSPAAAASPSGTPGSSTTPASSATPQVITLEASEQGQAYSFDKTEIRVRPGPVTIRLSNRQGSERPHTFDLKSSAGQDIIRSERAEPGQSVEVTFTLTAPGNYPFICALPGHADRGQRGTLIVAS